MADANLLRALRGAGVGGALENIFIYGKVRCAIKMPKFLENDKLLTEASGSFAILDAYALKCGGVDYFVEDGEAPQSIYFTKGSMLIYIKDSSWVGKLVKVADKYENRGVKVRQQLSAKGPYEGISAFAFNYRSDVNKFVITYNSLSEIKLNEIKSTPFEDFIVALKASEDGIVEYPVSLDSIQQYIGVEEYEVIDNTEKSVELDDFDLPKPSNKPGMEKPVAKETKIGFNKENGKIDVTKIDLKLTYHLQGMGLSEMYEDVKSDIANMSERRKEYLKEVSREMSKDYGSSKTDLDDVAKKIRKAFIRKIAPKYSNSIGDSYIRGKVYIDKLVDAFKEFPIGMSLEEMQNYSVPDMLKAVDELHKLVQIDSDSLSLGMIGDVELPMMSDNMQFSVVVISTILGISLEDLRTNYNSCDRMVSMSFKCWYYLLLNQPYLLSMLGSSLSVVDCDKIYYTFGRLYGDDGQISKNKDMRRDLVYLKTLDNADDKSTYVLESALKKCDNVYPGIAKRNVETYGLPLKKDLIELVKVYFGNAVIDGLTDKDKKEMLSPKWYSKERTEALVEKGIVNSIFDYLVLERDYEREFLVYDVFIKKGMEETGITNEQVKETIQKFEAERGFSLESLQKDGILLCKYKSAVLSGCAGSGKTTTSDCMTMCLKDNLGDEYVIVYGAPTGKACRRLAEVVHGNVKTIHSRFGVGMGSDGYLAGAYKRKPKESEDGKKVKRVYLFDEMAMCNGNLLYEIARNMQEDDLCYFLGDIKQLPAIGKGNPFYILMQMLPCVELGVSKRAAEGSEVNYNTTLVNCMSDGVVEELTYNEKDFICVECADAEIPNKVVKLWNDFMEGKYGGVNYKEEDIQVITGYAKEGISFSAPSLNIPLQNLLRVNDKLLFKFREKEFYKNERVIHVTANCYDVQRYIEVDDVLKGVVTTGIVNGEMGILDGVVSSNYCTIQDFEYADLDKMPIYEKFSKEELDELVEARQNREDTLRFESDIKDDRTYFVKVRVWDADLGREVIVLYTSRLISSDGVMVLGGIDLENLDLAYALTTHKMQGSQSPVVICVYGEASSPSFMNRNMINTMITRSQGVVGMVGSIKGPKSAVNRGRRYVSKVKTLDTLSLLVTGIDEV